MKGTRRDTDEIHTLSSGEYSKLPNGGVWFVTPDGRFGHVLPTIHTITWHEDGTVTVSPSILVRGGGPNPGGEWHGFLERGVWRTV